MPSTFWCISYAVKEILILDCHLPTHHCLYWMHLANNANLTSLTSMDTLDESNY